MNYPINRVDARANGFFLPFQDRIIDDPSPLIIVEKSRQVGVSWTVAFKLVAEKCVQGATVDGGCHRAMNCRRDCSRRTARCSPRP